MRDSPHVLYDLWDYYDHAKFVICITTNATTKKNGEAIMGRGCAAQAKSKIPGIARELGHKNRRGLYNGFLDDHRVYAFQVKNNWWEKADLDLIRNSATALHAKALLMKGTTFVLPRPGCGNGKLRWGEVRPLLEMLPDNVWIVHK